MKKTLSALLTASLVLSNSCTLPIFAAEDPTFSASNAAGYAGEEITVTVGITNNPGIINCQLQAGYDSDILTLKSAVVKDYDATSFGPLNKNPFTFSWSDSIHGNNTNNGILTELTFVIDENAPAGTYPITLTYDEDNVFNLDFDNVDFAVVNGWVTVEAPNVPVDSITVTPTEKTLKAEGETFTLTPTVTPDNATNKNVTFKSSDTSVATVDGNGVVTAVANGTATITATTEDGSKAAVCKVTVDIPHVHTMKKIEAKTSTCVVQGNNAYYSCEECGKYFKDEAGTVETTPAAEKLALADHKGGTASCVKKAICTVCGNEYGELAAHSYTAENTDTKYLKSEATCTAKAVYYYSCDVCGAVGTETFEYGEADKTNHSGNTKTVGQKEATCYEDGYTGDVVCADCNGVIEKGKVISAGHTPSDVWSTDSESHWKECTVGCGNIIDKSAHSGGNANCHAKAVCKVCGVEYGDIATDNHDGETEVRNAVPATEDSEGYTGDTYCLGCGEKIADGKVTVKLDHIHTMKKTEAVAATQTKDGNIEYYTCEKCGKLYKDPEGTTEITVEDTIIKMSGNIQDSTDANESSSSSDSGEKDNLSNSSAESNSDTASKPISASAGGNSAAKNSTDNPNTGAGSAALAAGVIALGALVVTKKKR